MIRDENKKIKLAPTVTAGVLLIIYVILELIYRSVSIYLILSLVALGCLIFYVFASLNAADKLRILVPVSFMVEMVLRIVTAIENAINGYSTVGSIITLLIWCVFCAVIMLSYCGKIKNIVIVKISTLILFIYTSIVQVISLNDTITYAEEQSLNVGDTYNKIILLLIIGIIETIVYYIAIYIVLPRAINSQKDKNEIVM